MLTRLGALLAAPRALAWTSVAYGLAAVGLFGVLALSMGAVESARALAAFLVAGVLPGMAVARLVIHRPGPLVLAVVGAVLGLALWTFGGVVGHLTGVGVLRWLPSVVALAAWAVPPRVLARVARIRLYAVPAAGVLAALVGVVALLPALRTALSTQRSEWTEWYHFYTDLPFHAAITGEVAARAAERAPWVADTPLSYTWFFHSSMGVWSASSGVSATDIVMQAWPVLFVILIPVVLVIVTWSITCSRSATVLAPLLLVLTHGVGFAPAGFDQVALFQISPTRDFASLYVLTALMALAMLLRSHDRRAIGSLVLLATSVFVATSSKGSAMPILAAGFLSALVALIVTRRVRRVHVVAAAAFAVSAAVSYVIGLPDPGISASLGFGPLTFLPPATPQIALVSVVIVLAVGAGVTGALVALGSFDRAGWPVAALLAGTVGAGLGAMALLSFAGMSQVYFWQSAQPALAILLAWTGAALWDRFGRPVVVAALVVLLVSVAVGIATSNPLVGAAALLVVASVAAVVVVVRQRSSQPSSAIRTALTVVVLAAVLAQAGQAVGLPQGTVGGAQADSSDPGAVHTSQRDALVWIRDHSNPDDVVVTNKHCQSGSLGEGDCDYRWFAVSAWAQRRVVVEGWGYTQFGPTEEWVADRLQLSDGFIAAPSAQGRAQLQRIGVRFVYVDTREPYSSALSDYGTLTFESEWARVYQLD